MRQAEIDSVRLFHAFDRLGRDLDFFLENLFVFRSPGVDDRPDRFYVRSDFWFAQKNQDGERVVGLEALTGSNLSSTSRAKTVFSIVTSSSEVDPSSSFSLASAALVNAIERENKITSAGSLSIFIFGPLQRGFELASTRQ